MSARYREAFDQSRDFVVVRDLQMSVGVLVAGQVFPKRQVTVRRLRQLFDSRKIGYPGEDGRSRARPPHPRPVKIVEWDSTMPTPMHRSPPAPAAAAPPAKPSPPVYDVEIPVGWQKWTWPRILSLASSLSDKPVRTKREVFTAIHQEIARRSRAEGQQAA